MADLADKIVGFHQFIGDRTPKNIPLAQPRPRATKPNLDAPEGARASAWLWSRVQLPLDRAFGPCAAEDLHGLGADKGPAEVEALEVRQARQLVHVAVGDAGVGEIEGAYRGWKVFQSRAAYARLSEREVLEVGTVA